MGMIFVLVAVASATPLKIWQAPGAPMVGMSLSLIMKVLMILRMILLALEMPAVRTISVSKIQAMVQQELSEQLGQTAEISFLAAVAFILVEVAVTMMLSQLAS